MRKLTASLGLWALITAVPAMAQFPFAAPAAPADPAPPAEAITVEHPADLPGREAIQPLQAGHPADLPGGEAIQPLQAGHPADLPTEANPDFARGNLTVAGPVQTRRDEVGGPPAFDTGATYGMPRRTMAQQLIFERARFRAQQRVHRIEARKWANISLLRPTIGNPNRPPLTPPYYGFGYPYHVGPQLIIVNPAR